MKKEEPGLGSSFLCMPVLKTHHNPSLFLKRGVNFFWFFRKKVETGQGETTLSK